MWFYETLGARCAVSTMSRKPFKGQGGGTNLTRGPVFGRMFICFQASVSLCLLRSARSQRRRIFTASKNWEPYPNSARSDGRGARVPLFHIPHSALSEALNTWRWLMELTSAWLSDTLLTCQITYVRAPVTGFIRGDSQENCSAAPALAHQQRGEETGRRARRLSFLIFRGVDCWLPQPQDWQEVSSAAKHFTFKQRDRGDASANLQLQ